MSGWNSCYCLVRMSFRGWLILAIVTVPVVMISAFFTEFSFLKAVKQIHNSVVSYYQFGDDIKVIGSLHSNLENALFRVILSNDTMQWSAYVHARAVLDAIVFVELRQTEMALLVQEQLAKLTLQRFVLFDQLIIGNTNASVLSSVFFKSASIQSQIDNILSDNQRTIRGKVDSATQFADIIRGVVTALVFGMVFFALDNKFGQLTDSNIEILKLSNAKSGFLTVLSLLTDSVLNADQSVLANTAKEGLECVTAHIDNMMEFRTLSAQSSYHCDAYGDIAELHKMSVTDVLEIKPVRISDIMCDLNKAFTKDLTLKQIDYRCKWPDPAMFPFSILTNGRRLKQLLGNVLSNAVKFSSLLGHVSFDAVILSIETVPEDSDPVLGTSSTRQIVIDKLNSQITNVSTSTVGHNALHHATLSQRAMLQLGVQRQRARVRFDVTDDGIGIDEDHLLSIFQPFSNVDQSLTRKYGGLGLGLPIAHQLARQMNGSLVVESEIGHGSKFSFEVEFDLMADVDADAHAGVLHSLSRGRRRSSVPMDGIFSGAALICIDSNTTSVSTTEPISRVASTLHAFDALTPGTARAHSAMLSSQMVLPQLLNLGRARSQPASALDAGLSIAAASLSFVRQPMRRKSVTGSPILMGNPTNQALDKTKLQQSSILFVPYDMASTEMKVSEDISGAHVIKDVVNMSGIDTKSDDTVSLHIAPHDNASIKTSLMAPTLPRKSPATERVHATNHLDSGYSIIEIPPLLSPCRTPSTASRDIAALQSATVLVTHPVWKAASLGGVSSTRVDVVCGNADCGGKAVLSTPVAMKKIRSTIPLPLSLLSTPRSPIIKPLNSAKIASDSLVNGTPSSTLSIASIDPMPVVARPLHVLVVEDTVLNMKFIVAMLENMGHRVYSAVNGQLGVDAVVASWTESDARLTQNSPLPIFDIVLMDISMPVMDGLSAARTIRKLEADQPSRGHLPIIAVTAHNGIAMEQQTIDAGMQMIMPKPIKKRELITNMNALTSVLSNQTSDNVFDNVNAHTTLAPSVNPPAGLYCPADALTRAIFEESKNTFAQSENTPVALPCAAAVHCGDISGALRSVMTTTDLLDEKLSKNNKGYTVTPTTPTAPTPKRAKSVTFVEVPFPTRLVGIQESNTEAGEPPAAPHGFQYQPTEKVGQKKSAIGRPVVDSSKPTSSATPRGSPPTPNDTSQRQFNGFATITNENAMHFGVLPASLDVRTAPHAPYESQPTSFQNELFSPIPVRPLLATFGDVVQSAGTKTCDRHV